METQSAVNPYTPPTFLRINVIAYFSYLWPYLPYGCLIGRVWFASSQLWSNPWAADSLGVNVYGYKYAGVILSGIFAGLAAATLYPHQWIDAMTAGRGFLALAAMIFGNYNPLYAVLAAMLFGYAETLTYFQTRYLC